MSQKYNDLAQKIVSLVGGKENINTVYHCQTRLRFKLKDESKADQDALNNMDSVAKCLISGGVFQVIIGTHVKDVFEEVEKIVGPLENKEQDQSEKKGILSVIIDFISGTFQPIIPALSGAGMVKAVLAILITFKIISTESQTYYILNFFADAVFYFLPMMLAYSEAQKLRCNPILAASVAGIMMHPNWNALVSAGKAVKLFEVIPFTLTTYTSTVIPVILVVLVQSYIEKYLEKWIPQAVKLVFVPMLTFLIMGPLALAVLGPIGSVLGGYLATFFKFLSTTAAWAPAVLIGGFLPIMVMFGLHNGVAPLGVMQMGELGYDSIFGPGCVCSNIAQATASSVVALRTKDKKMKQLATSGSITAYMGITEPTLFGVNLPKKYPLIASMFGGAAGGLYAGLTHTHRFATGSSGLPAVFLYIGNDTMTYFYNILIALVISFVVTAIVTYVLSLKFENQEVQTIEKVHVNKGEILSPIQGKLYPLSDAKDEAFASETLGKGALIQPSNGKVYAPFDGTIVTLFPTKHAIGIVSDDGIEMLIHFGIDTVNLNGQHFTAFIEQGMKVKQGDLLLEADIEKIKAAGYETQVPVIITNSFNYQNIELSSKEDVSYQDVILKVKGEK